MDERQQPGTAGYDALPAQDITVDQVVAWNMAHWRRAARMTQEELGTLTGWSPANVSAAERSADPGRDRRRFDAQTIAAVAAVLGVPVAALFLPPEDDGQGRRYQWRLAPGSPPLPMAALMQAVLHDNDSGAEVMRAYRDRFRGAVTAYLEEDWAAEVGTWFAPVDDAGARAEQAARFRSRQAALLGMAAEQEALADWLERGGGGP